jgi:hypothetical protein
LFSSQLELNYFERKEEREKKMRVSKKETTMMHKKVSFRIVEVKFLCYIVLNRNCTRMRKREMNLIYHEIFVGEDTGIILTNVDVGDDVDILKFDIY